MENNLGKNALKEEETNHKISIKSRKTVISLVADFIEEVFGTDAAAKMIKMTCCELIEIFPSLKYSPSDMHGIVSLHSLIILLFLLTKFEIFTNETVLRICYTTQQKVLVSSTTL